MFLHHCWSGLLHQLLRNFYHSHLSAHILKRFASLTLLGFLYRNPNPQLHSPDILEVISITIPSSYWNNAISCHVAIIFGSNLWGGNTSDRYITKFSGFLDFVKPGHEIMSDRGFLIRDLLLGRELNSSYLHLLNIVTGERVGDYCRVI